MLQRGGADGVPPPAPKFRHKMVDNSNGLAMKTSKKEQRKVVAYCRTSSLRTLGRAGLEIVDWFYDPAVSGADPIEVRPGFSALLDRIEGNGVLTVVVEDASRFARDPSGPRAWVALTDQAQRARAHGEWR